MEANNLKNIILISLIISTTTCTFIQKTKVLISSEKYLVIYSLLTNIIFSLMICIGILKMKIVESIIVGILSFVGSDTLYKELSDKLLSYNELRNRGRRKH